MKKSATAIWNGSGKEGSGHLTTESQAISAAAYSWKTRFTEEKGTNPEELIAAAHAGCFSMKLSFVLGEAGFTPDLIETSAHVAIESGSIISSDLVVRAKVPGISEDVFKSCAENAKDNCPVSKVLNAKISLDASLI